MRLIRSIPELPPLLVRGAVLLALSALPILLYLGLGVYLVWESGRFHWVWWTAPVCWGGAWLISRLWRPPGLRRQSLPLPEPVHWTPRDEAAAQIVKEYQQRVDELTPKQLTDPHYYLTTAQQLARDLARHYHPRAGDPISALTVPEALAALRLVADDLERWFLDAVPGSRLVTIRQWRRLAQAPKWFRRVQNVGWAASMLLNPASIVRYALSRATLDPVTKELQGELLAAVYLQFVRQTGYYLIEMNSGRLRGGADLYRRHVGDGTATRAPRAESPAGTSAAGATPAADAIQPVTVLLLGQAKAGKSSLINALLGETASEVDVLPCTSTLQRYRLQAPNLTSALTLIDAPGFAEDGLSAAQMRELQEGARLADAILLVMAAHQPARAPDRKVLGDLISWYAAQPQLKPPPVIAVLTHIDRLSPTLEWSPPYNWRRPARQKEQSIRGAVDYAWEVFGDALDVVVPVRTDTGHTYGIEEELLPAVAAVVGEARAAGLLRALHQQINKDRFATVTRQAISAGKELLRWWSESRRQ